MRLVELSNAENWELTYETSKTSQSVSLKSGRKLIDPIPSIEIPLLFESFILAVSITTSIPQGSVWEFGGRIYQRISTGLVLGGSQDAARVISKAIYLNQITLLIFEKISSTYSLAYSPPSWFESVGLRIWTYTGGDDTSSEILMAQEFSNINFKLDAILSKN